jgi:hypothetical protein
MDDEHVPPDSQCRADHHIQPKISIGRHSVDEKHGHACESQQSMRDADHKERSGMLSGKQLLEDVRDWVCDDPQNHAEPKHHLKRLPSRLTRSVKRSRSSAPAASSASEQAGNCLGSHPLFRGVDFLFNQNRIPTRRSLVHPPLEFRGVWALVESLIQRRLPNPLNERFVLFFGFGNCGSNLRNPTADAIRAGNLTYALIR